MRNPFVFSFCPEEIHFGLFLFCGLSKGLLSSFSQVTTPLLRKMAMVNASGSGDLLFSWILVMAAMTLFPLSLAFLP